MPETLLYMLFWFSSCLGLSHYFHAGVMSQTLITVSHKWVSV